MERCRLGPQLSIRCLELWLAVLGHAQACQFLPRLPADVLPFPGASPAVFHTPCIVPVTVLSQRHANGSGIQCLFNSSVFLLTTHVCSDVKLDSSTAMQGDAAFHESQRPLRQGRWKGAVTILHKQSGHGGWRGYCHPVFTPSAASHALTCMQGQRDAGLALSACRAAATPSPIWATSWRT